MQLTQKRTRKLLVAMIFMVICLSVTLLSIGSFAADEVTVILDNKTLEFKVKPFVINEVVYVPMLEFGNAMELMTVTSTTRKENLPLVGYILPTNQDIRFVVGSNEVSLGYSLMDQKTLKLDVPYPVVDGTAMVPIDVLKDFDFFKSYNIKYDSTTRTLSLTDKNYSYNPQPEVTKTGYTSLLWSGKTNKAQKDLLEKEIKALGIDSMSANYIRYGYIAEDNDQIYYRMQSTSYPLGFKGLYAIKKDSRTDKREIEVHEDIDVFMPLEEKGQLKGFFGQKNYSPYSSKPVIVSPDLKTCKVIDVPFKYISSYHILDRNRILVASFEGWDKTAKLYLYLLTVNGDKVEYTRLTEASEFVVAKGHIYFVKEWRGSMNPFGILYKADLSGKKLINQKSLTSFKVWNLHTDNGELYVQKTASAQLFKGENFKTPVHTGSSSREVVAYGGNIYSSSIVDAFSGTHKLVKYTVSNKKKTTGVVSHGYLVGINHGSFVDLLRVDCRENGIEHRSTALCLPSLNLDKMPVPMKAEDDRSHYTKNQIQDIK